MKKNVLMKSALAAAVVATTATAIADVTLYGRYRAGLIMDDDGTTDQWSLQNGSSRFGIKAKAPISDSLTAFGRYEFGVNLDEGALSNSTSTNRLAYVGLNGGFGQIAIGSQWSPFYNHIVSPVDPNQMFGGTNGGGAANLTTYRLGDMVTYSNSFGPANIEVGLVFDESTPDDVDRAQVGASFGFGPVNLGLAYDAISDSTANDGNTRIGVHAGGKFGPANVGLSYITEDVDTSGDTNEAIQALLGFGFGSGMNVDVTFGQYSPEAGSEPTTIAAEFSHKLSKSFRYFAGIQVTDLDAVGSDDVTKAGVGMRLEF